MTPRDHPAALSASGPEASDPSTTCIDGGFLDIDGVLRIPRITGLAAGPDGRLVASIAEADADGARMVSALWELDPSGHAPARRLTHSKKGESSPRFMTSGHLLFTSSRPDPSGVAEEGVPAIWCLPPHGEARVIAATAGGLGLEAVGTEGSILASTSVLAGSTITDDAAARDRRSDSRRTTIWHTGMPVRYWDHELDEEHPRLVMIRPDGAMADLAVDADGVALRGAGADVAPDGSFVVTTWTDRVRGGETRTGIHRIDIGTGARTVLLPATEDHSYSSPVLSAEGSRLAVIRSTASTPSSTSLPFLEIHDLSGGDALPVDVGDLTPGGMRFTASGDLLVWGDLHSSGAILRVDGGTGEVSTVADGGVYSAVEPMPDGTIAALRTDVATPARPVIIPAGDGEIRELQAPGDIPALPGTIEWMETEVDGARVGAWLCLPHGASAAQPAPAQLWIHGGPHGSYNAWSWRWNPWFQVASGYAVLMPDPAMSTGYGHAGLNRGWPRRAGVVYAECEELFDLVLERPEVDGSRTAMLGASFGGFMANWIAGHTDRFDAIVSHAGLWALPQQHRTTDAAAGKMRVHGREDDESGPAQWYRENSPHLAAANIRTPMLITHGKKDFRVPFGEALRLWWDLVSGWDGEPDSMPHRFLELTSENHWVMTPANATVWNRTVLAFCDQHVRGGEPIPEVLPWG